MLWLTWMACGLEALLAPEEPASNEVVVAEEAAAAIVPEAALGQVRGTPKTEAPPFEPTVTLQGVGFIGHETKKKVIEKRLGKDAVADYQFDQGEGNFLPGLQVLGGTPWELLLQTDGETIERIQIVGEGYQLGNGLHVGSTFDELKRALGEFEMFGWGWDYGGTLAVEPPKKSGYQLAVRTEPAKDRKWSKKAREVLRGGDRKFASSHEAMAELNPHVASITLIWKDVAVEANKR